MPQINLLPWREEARQAKRIRFGLNVAAVVVLATICVLAIHSHYKSLIAYQDGRNSFIATRLGYEQTNLNGLNKNNKIQESVVNKLQFIIALRLADYKAVELLNYLTKIIPESVIFTKVSRVQDTITVTGHAKSNLQITQLMKNIATIPLFHEPQLSLITGKEDKAGQERIFQLIFTQKQ